MSDSGSSGGDSGGGGGGGLLGGITSSFSKPGDAGLSSSGVGGSFGLKEFMESNSLVAKFAFILMVFIVLSVAVKIAIIGVSYLLLPSMSPYVLNGTANTEDLVIAVTQDPSKKDSIFISRSMNEDGGLEYTWSAWFFINQVPNVKDKYSRIFSKGGEGTKSSEDGIYYPNNAPGLYIKFSDDITTTNPDRKDKGVNVSLLAVVDVSGKSSNSEDKRNNLHEKLITTDIPIKNWVNAVIRVTNNVIDLYINGRLAQRRKTAGIPIQNYGTVNIGEAEAKNRFSGYISTIQYFNYSIGSNKINSIVNEGPNMKMLSNSGAESSTKNLNYLSNNWYTR
jgi:hypothetical protein